MKPAKIVILSLIISMICLMGYAQDNVASIKLSDGEKLITTLSIGDNGLIIKTGKVGKNTKKLSWKLKYYSDDLKLLWDVPLQTLQSNSGIKSPVVATPSGSYVYHREVISAPSLTQIDKEGTVRIHPLQYDKAVSHIKHIFCDETYLYFVSTVSGKEFYADKKMLKEQIIIKRIRHRDFSEKNILLELPLLTVPKTQSFWTYVGHSEEGIYFMKSTINKKEAAYNYHIVTVSSEGKITRNVSIDLSLEGKHMRPSGNHKISTGNYQYDLPDFNSNYAHYVGYGHQIRLRMDNMDGFGSVVVDNNNECMYIYGLYGPAPFKTAGSKYEGYFIYKYDMDGSSEWKVKNKVSTKLYTNSYFKIHAEPASRSLVLRVFPDKIKFQIWFKKEVHSYELSTGGEAVTDYINNFGGFVTTTEAKMSYAPSEKVKMLSYLSTLTSADVKNTYMQYYPSNKGEILLLDRRDRNTIDLLKFEAQ